MDASALSVRDARRGEASALAGLIRAAFQQEADFYAMPEIRPLRLTAADVLPDIDDAVVLVAEDGGRLVATATGQWDAPSATCSLRHVAVHPDHQRRGLGRRLVLAVEARFPEARRYALFTGHRSAGNLRLYERLGYHVTHEGSVSPTEPPMAFMEKPGPAA